MKWRLISGINQPVGEFSGLESSVLEICRSTGWRSVLVEVDGYGLCEVCGGIESFDPATNNEPAAEEFVAWCRSELFRSPEAAVVTISSIANHGAELGWRL